MTFTPFPLSGIMCSANDRRRSVAIVVMCAQLIEGGKQLEVGGRGEVEKSSTRRGGLLGREPWASVCRGWPSKEAAAFG